MLVLGMDTSTRLLSLALVRDGEPLAVVDEVTENNQSEILMSRIEAMMGKCGLVPGDLDLIGVALGPGSYTGVRVGVAVAKSLGYVLDVPVVGVSSLEVMAVASGCDGVVVPMMDARRGTVFASVVGPGREVLVPEGHGELEDVLARLPEGEAIWFVGDGAAAHRDRLLDTSRQVRVVEEADLERGKAEVVAELARVGSPIRNIHELTPNYLRKTEAEMNVGV